MFFSPFCVSFVGVFFNPVLGNKSTQPPVLRPVAVAVLPYSFIIDVEICGGNIQDVDDKSPAMLLLTAELSAVKIETRVPVHQFRAEGVFQVH